MDQSAPESEAQERAFFVIGQWSGGDVDIWRVEEAPADPGERADVHDQHQLDAEEAFGSVEVVYASSPQEAATGARREARETSERISRGRAR